MTPVAVRGRWSDGVWPLGAPRRGVGAIFRDAHIERPATLQRCDAVDLPAAEDGTHPRSRRREERNVVDVRRDEPMANIPIRVAVVAVPIEGIHGSAAIVRV